MKYEYEMENTQYADWVLIKKSLFLQLLENAN